MNVVIVIMCISIIAILVRHFVKQAVAHKRERYIESYTFPETITKKVAETYPDLNERELKQVTRGLKDYFHIANLAHKQLVAMPSQVVDIAWHEFILFTKAYEGFCSKSVGRFLHHTPAEAMKSREVAQEGIKRAWRIACHRENIKPHSPKKLPLIFAIDARLRINDGFHYELNCIKLGAASSAGCGGYCGSHIGCSSGCAGSAGDGGCAGDSGGGGGCGGGD